MNDLIAKQITDLEQRLKWVVDNFTFRISQAVGRLRDGKTTLTEFRQFGRDELREAYYVIAEIGKGEPLTAKEQAQVRAVLKEQVGYWDNFCQDIAKQMQALDGKGLEGDELKDAFNALFDKFDRRAQSYAGRIEAEGQRWAMAGEEGQWYRWVRSPVESCHTCLDRDGGVWQMKDGRLPFYPRDGNSECLYNCMCHWEPISRFRAMAIRALGKLKGLVGRKSFEEIADEWLEKGGPGSGWYGPPRGTHRAGARAGGKVKTAKQARAELIRNSKRQMARLEQLRARGDVLAKQSGDMFAEFDRLRKAGASQDELDKISRESDKVWDKLGKNEKEYWSLASHIRDGALERLKVDNPAQFETSTGRLHKGKEEFQEGCKAFANLVGRSTLDGKTVTMHTTKGDRGYYDKDGIWLPPSNRCKTVVVHELGHWLEDKDPDVHAKATDFLERRTKGEKEVSLQSTTGHLSYKSWEVTKKDRFSHPYMGKQYRRTPGEPPYATEIISMGMEEMYINATEFAQKDPEYFDFMYDLMRGR